MLALSNRIKLMSAVSQLSTVSQIGGNLCLLSLKPKKTHFCCLSNWRNITFPVSQTEGNLCLLSLNCLLSLKPKKNSLLLSLKVKESYDCSISNRKKLCLLSLNFMLSLKRKETCICFLSNWRKPMCAVFQTKENSYLHYWCFSLHADTTPP